tara:strand:+ start:473 stop:1111 length:639 start_codon:yes stop_codon:yes gene_type:complete
MKNIKLAFLLDKTNNWMLNFIKNSRYKNIKRIKIFWNIKKIKNYDLVFIINYTKLIPKKYLKNNRFNLVIHSSNLPKGKGFAPLQWQILENKKKIFFSMININHKIDSGDIIMKSNIKLNGSELYEELRQLQSKKILEMINKVIKIFPKIKFEKQKGKGSVYKKRSLNDSEININKSIKSQFNKFRIVNNEKWPAFFYFKKKKYILKIYKNA